MTVFLIFVITLCLIVIAYMCNEWRNEKRISTNLRRDLEDERRWSNKMCEERNDAIKRYIELEKAQREGASNGYEAPVAEVIGSSTV